MNLRRIPPPLIAALVLATGVAISMAHAQTTTTNLLAIATFDPEAPSDWGYGYFYGDDGNGMYEGPYRQYYAPDDIEYLDPMCQYLFDLSWLEGRAGYGTGFGGPLFRPDPDPALFTSSNRVDYVFSFDAREGLAEGVTSANLEMQVQLFNSEQTPDKILQVNLPFTAGSNWVHVTRNLEDGALGDGTSDERFAGGYRNVTTIQYNVNSHDPHTAFGFDWDNAIYVDNLKLEVIVRPDDTSPALPTVAYPIAVWDMDDSPLFYTFEYAWSQNEMQPTATGSVSVEGSGNGSPNGWRLVLDSTILADLPPAWAGGGTGGEGPADYTRFDSGDLADYRISFDARVSGLAPERETASAALQLFLRAPDDTLSPADDNADRDELVRLDFPVADASPTWKSYSVSLSKGGAGLGSKENFTRYFSHIDQLTVQWQIENLADVAVWGYDADNTLEIDNIRIERIYKAVPPLTIALSGEDVVITWESPGSGVTRLQSAPTCHGEFSDVEGASSPYHVPLSDGSHYFRTVWTP